MPLASPGQQIRTNIHPNAPPMVHARIPLNYNATYNVTSGKSAVTKQLPLDGQNPYCTQTLQAKALAPLLGRQASSWSAQSAKIKRKTIIKIIYLVCQ